MIREAMGLGVEGLRFKVCGSEILGALLYVFYYEGPTIVPQSAYRVRRIRKVTVGCLEDLGLGHGLGYRVSFQCLFFRISGSVCRLKLSSEPCCKVAGRLYRAYLV